MLTVSDFQVLFGALDDAGKAAVVAWIVGEVTDTKAPEAGISTARSSANGTLMHYGVKGFNSTLLTDDEVVNVAEAVKAFSLGGISGDILNRSKASLGQQMIDALLAEKGEAEAEAEAEAPEAPEAEAEAPKPKLYPHCSACGKFFRTMGAPGRGGYKYHATANASPAACRKSHAVMKPKA